MTETVHQKEHMNIVVVGHVDHGKSTLIGRLMADTNSLPQGKLEQVKLNCERNAKPFEYAFLLDALKDEQSQGITIDTARCFFKTQKRHYIIIDAPGHIEFLKNMITGAARAEAALLLIDAHEGVQENSRRHGYMLSMLGIQQIVVCVNKMDLMGYKQSVFDAIKKEYSAFLSEIGVRPQEFIPISGREGDNMVSVSKNMPWYKGPYVLAAIDAFEKEKTSLEKPFRFPVQDIYKFTAQGDDRRIFAGRVETGSIKPGEEVVFLPSQKTSKIKAVEGFHVADAGEAFSGQSTGFTLQTQIYVKPGEIMCRVADKALNKLPKTASRFRVNLFWLGRQPMIFNKQYKLKIGTERVAVWLDTIHHVLDASELTTVKNKKQIDRHDVCDCTLQTFKPIAFDLTQDIAVTSRFVIVDDYEISGGGIIVQELGTDNKRLQDYVERRERSWERSEIKAEQRRARLGHGSMLIVFTGHPGLGKQALAKMLEQHLFGSGRYAYYLGLSNTLSPISGVKGGDVDRSVMLTQLGEMAHLFTDAGLILITSISDADDADMETLRTLNHPNDLVVINVGQNQFSSSSIVDLQLETPGDATTQIKQVLTFLQSKKVIPDYMI